MSQPAVVPLADALDLAEHGGKAVNLARLVRYGFDVPPGFCLPTTWYRRQRALLDVPASPEPDELRRAFAAAPLPPDLAAVLRAAYAALGGGPVAVRSSATTEDLDDASFAGQQDTYLDVEGEDALLDAVARCWGSLWNRHAASYRRFQGVDAEPALAVVVQRMVPAVCAGVTFTANPVTGCRDELVVDAAPGLGEAVVSGSVDPEHVVLRAGAPVPDPGPGSCLTRDRLTRVAEIGRAVQDRFGGPQDVEWAVDPDDRLWLTQTRPVTTLFPVPRSRHREAPREDDLRVLLCASHSWQGIQGPVTAAGLSALVTATASVHALSGRPNPDVAHGTAYVATAGSRWFLDLTGPLRDATGRRVVTAAVGLVDARAQHVLRELGESTFEVRTDGRGALVRYAVRVGLRHGVLPRVLGAVVSPRRARTRTERLRAAIEDSAATSGPGVDGAQALVLRWVGPVWARIVPLTGVATLLAGLGARWAGATPGDPDVVAATRAVPHNVTTTMDLELWDALVADPAAPAAVAGRTPDDLWRAYLRGELPAPLQAGVRDLLQRHGHRSVAEIDLGVPRWSEDGTPVMSSVLALAELHGAGGDPRRDHLAAAAEASRAIDRLAARAGVRGRAVRRALRGARELLGLREQAKYLNVLVLARAREKLAATGERLAARGLVDVPDDVFHLDFDEIRRAEAGEAMHDAVAAHRAEHRREARRTRVPNLLLSDGTDPETTVGAVPAGEGAMRGTPASAGVVVGRANVVTEPSGAVLRPGDVLVAPTTDPAWTPLFLAAAAVVVQTGGVNSHGAVVAREFGIPAVVGVSGVLTRIRSGDIVEIDGSTGSVRVVEPAAVGAGS